MLLLILESSTLLKWLPSALPWIGTGAIIRLASQVLRTVAIPPQAADKENCLH